MTETNTQNHAALPIGHELHNYKIIKMLGSGAFGIVYLGEHVHLGNQVAIKEFMPDFAIRKEGTQVYPRTSGEDTDNFQWGLNAFLNEAKTLAQFQHPNILHIQDFFEANNSAYMVMEYIVGIPLNEVLKEEKQLSEAHVKAMLQALLNGLKIVHQGNVYHRDIKPANIMLRENGEPVLIDFGAAREKMGVKTQTVMFTPGYGAFEQYQSKGNTGPWTDIYALAATAYHCLTGQAPPEASERTRNDPLQSIASLTQESSEPFNQSIENGLMVFDDERPQSIDEWEEQLLLSEEVNTPKPVLQQPPLKLKSPESEPEPKPIEPPNPPSGPFSLPVILTISLLLCFSIGGTWWFITSSAEEQARIKQELQAKTAWLKKLNLEFIKIPSGCFQMGNKGYSYGYGNKGYSNEVPQHKVCITKDYDLGKYEVTHGQWHEIMGENPSKFKRGPLYPVEQVSWNNVQTYIKKLNQLTGKTYRLPTEAEWEYAARAGTNTEYSFGDDSKQLYRYGNFCDSNCKMQWKDKKQNDGYKNTSPVGNYQPNPWGLYDMHGNVLEWVEDKYDKDYYK